jgi:monoterpene epsilon-lactone hydrolase
MASREFETMMAAMTSDLVSPSDTTEAARDKLNALHGHPIRADTQVAWVQLGGVRCARVDVAGLPANAPLLFLCHGGAYIAAGGDGYLFYAEMLGRACNTRVLLVDYRLAPEARHPAALDDCFSAYRALLESGQSPEQVILIGDSCGGTLAITTLLRIRDAQLPLPAKAVALGGWFDLDEPSGDRDLPPGEDPFAHPDFTRARGRDYVGPDGDLRDPLVSPVYADLAGLPSLLLQVGQIDQTCGDAQRLAERARSQGVDVTLEVHPEMIHGFQGLANAGIPEAGDALRNVADFIAAPGN